MTARGLFPDFRLRLSSNSMQFAASAVATERSDARNLRHLLWCSIDNDDSRDLDQISVGEVLPQGATQTSLAIADVSSVVRSGSAFDDDAPAKYDLGLHRCSDLPMLPEKLPPISPRQPGRRTAFPSSFVHDILRGRLAPLPRKSSRRPCAIALSSPTIVGGMARGTRRCRRRSVPVAGLADNLKLPVSRHLARLAGLRHQQGALSLETMPNTSGFDGQSSRGWIDFGCAIQPNALIEDLMIASTAVPVRGRRF